MAAIKRISYSDKSATTYAPTTSLELKLSDNIRSWQRAIDGLQSISDQIKEQKRKQKHIDRIAWEAERQQRYQKGGKWK